MLMLNSEPLPRMPDTTSKMSATFPILITYYDSLLTKVLIEWNEKVIQVIASKDAKTAIA